MSQEDPISAGVDAVRQRNERLTRVGRGTPMGEYLRRFWQPIAPSVELTLEADLPVLPVQLLGERLALFRCDDGSLGLVSERCPHRGAALSYGIVDGEGIRCPYHTWKFDKTGRCVDTPTESAGSTLKERVRVDGYPVQELGGFIWAYLGPLPAPLLPRWEFAVREDYQQDIGVSQVPCNWLQVAENTMDPVHIEFLHMAYTNHVRRRKGLSEVPVRRHEKLEFTPFEYGIVKKRLWEGDTEDSEEWTVGHPQLYPGHAVVSYHNGWVQFQIRVPRDDTNTTLYWYNCRPRQADGPPPGVVPVWDNPWANEEGRYITEQLNAQDMMVLISQGPITDHTKENLGETDKGIVMYRRALLREIDKVERGEDPTGIIRDEAKNTPWIDIPVEREVSFALSGIPASAAYDFPDVDLKVRSA